MTARKPTGGQAGGDVQELRRDIDQTRQELGDTVEALARKADVRARARETMAEARRRIPRQVGPMPLPAILAGVGLIAIVAFGWWRRRRS
jgi:MYXO-CTERM domain-containing protein